MLTDDDEEATIRVDHLFSVLCDKTGKAIRLKIAMRLLAEEPKLGVPLGDLMSNLSISREMLASHLRRLYDAGLITNPTRSKAVAASDKLIALEQPLTMIFERI